VGTRAVARRRRVPAAAAALVAYLLQSGSGVVAAQPRAAPLEAGVRAMLQQYADALESLDPAAVRKFHPSIDVELLRKAFREMQALDVVIDDIRVLSSEGAIVRAGCRVTQTLTPRAGAKQTTTVTRVMRLRSEDGSWVIDSFER